MLFTPSQGRGNVWTPSWPKEYDDLYIINGKRAVSSQRSVAIQRQETETIYNHPADKFWSLYLAEADKQDMTLVESWKGETDSILMFVCPFIPRAQPAPNEIKTGLFAATVATFATQSYPLLITASTDSSVIILA
jgi:hypothetical protein